MERAAGRSFAASSIATLMLFMYTRAATLELAQSARLQDKATKYRTHWDATQAKRKGQDRVACKEPRAGTATRRCPLAHARAHSTELARRHKRLDFCKHADTENIQEAAQSPPAAQERAEQRDPHLFAGELRPPLPREEVDRVVAMESLLASSTGSVLGSRSGRPR